MSLTPLIQFHLDELSKLSEDDEQRRKVTQSLISLSLASAKEKKLLMSASASMPAQVVVVGPTQSGKSTLVNLLLGLNSAHVSAQAGYTVHCQGFSVGDGDFAWLEHYFDQGTKVEQSSLQRDVLNEYSCAFIGDHLDTTLRSTFADTVFWDTPDFDSVNQSQYRGPVLSNLALADLVLMVVSKEKYADKSVWDMLKMLLMAGKQVSLIVNKASEEVREALMGSVQSKLDSLMSEVSGGQRPSVRFLAEASEPLRELQGSTDLVALRDAVKELAVKEDEVSQRETLLQMVRDYWPQWTTVISEQHDNQEVWRDDVDLICESLIQKYQQEYLEHKRQDETLRLAVAELLVLLEVPGLAEPLTKLRNLVTWPVRKVLTAARQLETLEDNTDSRSEEERLLESLYDHSITELALTVSNRRQADESDHLWWHQLEQKFGESKPAFKQGFSKETDNYQTLLKVETERAARSLYNKLEEQPATLNSLRAARVSADAAAVVLAVKSGGLGAADLVIAPAVLSLTTMLTESALGQYMNKIQQDLKRYQQKSVSSLVNRKLKMKLRALSGSSSTTLSSEKLAELARHYQLEGL